MRRGQGRGGDGIEDERGGESGMRE